MVAEATTGTNNNNNKNNNKIYATRSFRVLIKNTSVKIDNKKNNQIKTENKSNIVYNPIIIIIESSRVKSVDSMKQIRLFLVYFFIMSEVIDVVAC